MLIPSKPNNLGNKQSHKEMERKCGRWQLRIQERDRTYGRFEAKGEKSKQRLNLNLETREIKGVIYLYLI